MSAHNYIMEGSNLADRIMDEADEAREYGVLSPDASDQQVLDLVGDILDITLQPDSVGARLALATWHRDREAAKVWLR